MARARGLGHEAGDQALHDVGHRAEVERRAGARGVALGEDVHQQRQRQRVAVGQLDGPVAEVGGHAGAGEHGPRVLRLQVAQGDDAQQVAPAGVPAPRLAGRARPAMTVTAPAGMAGMKSSRNQSSSAQRLLEGVEEQHRPVALGQRRRHRRAGREAHRARRARPRTRAGPGSIERRSRRTASAPASAAASASAASRAVLPTPPGPWTQRTLKAARARSARPGRARARPSGPRTSAAAHASSAQRPSAPAAAHASSAAHSETSPLQASLTGRRPAVTPASQTRGSIGSGQTSSMSAAALAAA